MLFMLLSIDGSDRCLLRRYDFARALLKKEWRKAVDLVLLSEGPLQRELMRIVEKLSREENDSGQLAAAVHERRLPYRQAFFLSLLRRTC